MKPHMQTELQTQAQRSGLRSVPYQQVNKTCTPVKCEEGFTDYFSSPALVKEFQEVSDTSSYNLVYNEYNEEEQFAALELESSWKGE